MTVFQISRCMVQIIILSSSKFLNPMNSPANNMSFIHQARYMPRSNQAANMYLVKSPVLVHHSSMNAHSASYNTMPHIHTQSQIPQNTINNRNTPNKRIQHKYFQAQPRNPEVSQCSIKQVLQINFQQEMKKRMNTINQSISTIFTKLATHDEKIKELSSKAQKPQKETWVTEEKVESLIWKTVEKQINQSQQHFMLQNRMITSDIQALKLEMLCFSTKEEVKELTEKKQIGQNSIRSLVKQLQSSLKNETEKGLERRKKDIQLFQKQLQQIRAKLMEILFDQQNRQSHHQLCLIKSLSLKVLHQMKVYNEDQLQWIQLGTGESVYGLDEEGYLLDGQSKYITNPNGELIRLEESHIEILKKYGLTR